MRKYIFLILVAVILLSGLVLAQEFTGEQSVGGKRTTTTAWDVYPNGTKVLVNKTIEEEITEYKTSQMTWTEEFVRYLLSLVGIQPTSQKSENGMIENITDENEKTENYTKEAIENNMKEPGQDVGEDSEHNLTEQIDEEVTEPITENPEDWENFLDESKELEKSKVNVDNGKTDKRQKNYLVWFLFGILSVLIIGGILIVIYRNKIYEFILEKF